MLPPPTDNPEDPHRFVAPGPDDVRSPCPALNTLANHSYLNHDGKGLTASQLIRAQVDLFHISYPLAASLAISSILLLGNGRTVTLEQLRKHQKIEHDASLSRHDASTGNNYSIVPELVEQLLADASWTISGSGEPGIIFRDLARARATRNATLTKPLDAIHSGLALSESALIILSWGVDDVGSEGKKERVVPISRMRSFFLHETFPPGWTQPKDTSGIIKVVSLCFALSKLIKEVKEEQKST